jgi:hypothetical protein
MLKGMPKFKYTEITKEQAAAGYSHSPTTGI